MTAYKYIRMDEAVEENPALLISGLSDAYKQARIVRRMPAPNSVANGPGLQVGGGPGPA